MINILQSHLVARMIWLVFLKQKQQNPRCLVKNKSLISFDGVLSKEFFMKDWHTIWLAFAIYALIIAIAFAILFKHKHNPEVVAAASHH
jgi:NHS family xanthosine MFS transporter